MTTETDHDSKWLSVARSQVAAASAYICWRARGRHQAFEAAKLVMTELIQILSFQRPGASCPGVPPNAVYSVKNVSSDTACTLQSSRGKYIVCHAFKLTQYAWLADWHGVVLPGGCFIRKYFSYN